jgi:hypothetical protein
MDRVSWILRQWTASQKLAWMNKTISAIESFDDPKTMEFNATGYEWK